MTGLDPVIAGLQSGREAMRGSSPRMTKNINFQIFSGMELPAILSFLNPGQQWAFAGMMIKLKR
jgi:hypothetical protein